MRRKNKRRANKKVGLPQLSKWAGSKKQGVTCVVRSHNSLPASGYAADFSSGEASDDLH